MLHLINDDFKDGGVLACLSYCNKNTKKDLVSYEQQTFTSHSSGGWEIQELADLVSGGDTSWFVDGFLLAASCILSERGRERGSKVSSASFHEDTNPHPHNLITF